jgi:hypothetical protein
MVSGRRRAAVALLLLATPSLSNCASDTRYDAPGGQLTVVVTADTDPPDHIWQISSRGPEKKEWTVGCLSDDGSSGSFRDIHWTDARSFEIVTSEDNITVRVSASGQPTVAGQDLGLRPCS